jgi:hypothetical protein
MNKNNDGDNQVYAKAIKKKVNLPQKPTTQINKMEKIGYRVANGVHKVAVLSLVFFIFGNIFYLGKQYNDYWRARRVIFKLYINNFYFLAT